MNQISNSDKNETSKLGDKSEGKTRVASFLSLAANSSWQSRFERVQRRRKTREHENLKETESKLEKKSGENI